MLSAVSQQVQTIQEALKEKAGSSKSAAQGNQFEGCCAALSGIFSDEIEYREVVMNYYMLLVFSMLCTISKLHFSITLFFFLC